MIRKLAKAKLNSIESIILEGIQDSNIIEKEYAFVNDKVNKYRQLEGCIIKKIRITLSYFERRLIEYGYKKVLMNKWK